MSRVLDRPRTLDDLIPLDRSELMALFRTLPPPEPMDGEFVSALPAYSERLWRDTMASLGKPYWLGKSYSPEAFDGHQGHGLNRYRTETGSIQRVARFVWDIGPSTVDDRVSLVMRYGHFANWGGSHDLIDEIRLLAPGLYIGLYHTARPVPGFTPRDGGARSGIEFFFLTGPAAPFVPADAD
ncbi:MAG: hypothetical protein JSS43_32175 [Proteobacteria bacterium]|nr:hypothetical protein [Pseudomonadota bacterium]